MLEQNLCDGEAASGIAVGKVDRVVATQGEELLQDLTGSKRKRAKRFGLEAAGLNHDGKQLGCKSEAGEERGCGMGRGEKRLGCRASLPSVCTCNIKNRVISDTSR